MHSPSILHIFYSAVKPFSFYFLMFMGLAYIYTTQDKQSYLQTHEHRHSATFPGTQRLAAVSDLPLSSLHCYSNTNTVQR